jgi:transposase
MDDAQISPFDDERLSFVVLVNARAQYGSDGVDAPPTASLCQSGGVESHSREASMRKVSTIGLDLAKNVFQAHGADASGVVIFRKKLGRAQVLEFFAAQSPCVVAMEACGGSHFRGREIGKFGHRVRLVPPAYVKPFVKRQKNDAADAEAICEAAQRPTMRFVAVKSEAAQGAAVVFRTRDILVRQRTQIINALRGHLTEFGLVVAQGPAHVAKLVAAVQDMLDLLDQRIKLLDIAIALRAKEDEIARRLMSIPGVGPVIATAVAALAPPAETFKRGRDFAAWLGLTPLQHSTGGKQRLGATSKMGDRTLRRLLIIGASSVVRWAARKGAPEGSWLARMIARKPAMLIRVALANKMARVMWALMAKGGTYRAPVATA